MEELDKDHKNEYQHISQHSNIDSNRLPFHNHAKHANSGLKKQLFGNSPSKALLLPPFADLLALVNTTLFLCGAADLAGGGEGGMKHFVPHLGSK